MKIQTKYLQEVHIEKSKIIHFRSGLPGFLEETEFIVLDLPGNPIFQALQSIKTEDLAFIVTNPYHFYTDYEFKLEDQIIESLEIESEQDVAVLTIVTLKSPFELSTINLKAPIIINSIRQQGKQYILNTADYPTKASITSSNSSETKGD